MSIHYAIDEPTKLSVHYRQRIPIRGWIYVPDRQAQLTSISVHCGDQHIGTAFHLHERPDVAEALNLPAGSRTGFRLVGALIDGESLGTPRSLNFRANFADGSAVTFTELTIQLSSRDFTDAPYGDLCNPQKTAQLSREHIYSTGNPAATANPESVALISAFLDPGSKILDIGCGIGAYATPLITAGFRWTGCEINSDFLEKIQGQGLDCRAIRAPAFPSQDYTLPARDSEFDAAIAIEVLEHVRNPDLFLKEISRVVKGRAILSVPNMETLPFLADRLAAPWHLLERDHHNFFTRFNLQPLLRRYFPKVDVLEYGTQPLRSPDGIPLAYHLMAICSH